MQKSYTKNYLKIYFWQAISLVLNFLSMFVVMPYLTSDPTIYGIYAVCTSISIFLAYADLGFLAAGQKFAAEYFAKGDKDAEIKVVSFTIFILSLFLVLFCLIFLLLSQQPQFFVKGINTLKHEKIASSIFLILAVFTPTTLLQRLSQIIFGIRMEDFIIQRINILGSIVKITSVLWFFQEGSYDIVGYFLFTQVINLLVVIIILLIARSRYEYSFKILFQSFRFNNVIYNKTKSLAFASLFITLSWILYYELDTLAIAFFLGAHKVAIYAVGLTILSFFRSIFGIIFAPISIRFNHFIGADNELLLKSFYLQIVTVFAPLVVLPIIAFTLIAEPIVLSWIGFNYQDSVVIIQFLVFCNFFAFITYPTNFMLIAKERQNELYFINILAPVVYWLGIILTVGEIGIDSFAFFKFVSFLLYASVLYRIMINYFGFTLIYSLKRFFLPMMPSIIFLLMSFFLIRDYLPHEKSTINLLTVAMMLFILIIFSFLINYLVSKDWRKEIVGVIVQFRKN